MPKRYNLTSEITRVRNKYPSLELYIPEVGTPPVTTTKGQVVELTDVDESPYWPEATVVIPSIEVLPDDVVEIAATNPVLAAKKLLVGHYAHYTAAGGTGSLLFQILQEHSKATLGESEGSAGS